MTPETHLTATALKKVFNRRVIFQGISFSLKTGETLLISGRNGSGKSTLAKIVSGVLTPTSGSVELASGGKVTEASRLMAFGFVAPYLQLYDEFSSAENLRLAMGLRGVHPDDGRVGELLELVGLGDRRNDPVRTYSSGMKQRTKYAFALMHRPPVLILDEPMANLDSEGISLVRSIMASQRRQGILVVATNDLTDIDHFEKQIDLNAAGSRP